MQIGPGHSQTSTPTPRCSGEHLKSFLCQALLHSFCPLAPRSGHCTCSNTPPHTHPAAMPRLHPGPGRLPLTARRRLCYPRRASRGPLGGSETSHTPLVTALPTLCRAHHLISQLRGVEFSALRLVNRGGQEMCSLDRETVRYRAGLRAGGTLEIVSPDLWDSTRILYARAATA